MSQSQQFYQPSRRPNREEEDDQSTYNAPLVGSSQGKAASDSASGTISDIDDTLRQNEGFFNPNGDDSKNPVSSEDLRSGESGAVDKSVGKRDASTSKSALAAAEGAGIVGSGALGEGGLYNPNPAAAKLNNVMRIAGLLVRNKRGMFGGGIVGALIVAIILGSGFVASHELVNIQKTILGEESKLEHRTEQKVSKQIAKEIIKRLRNKAGSAQEAAAAPDSPLADAIDTYPLEDLKNSLSGQGISAEFDKAGNLTKLTSPAGEDMLSDSMSDTAFSDLLKALPEDQVGLLEAYRPIQVADSGVSFQGLPEDVPEDKVKTALVDDVEKGATPADVAEANAEVQQNADNPSPNQTTGSTAGDAAATNSLDEATGPLKDAIKATNDTLAATGDSAAAIAAGASKFSPKLGNSLLLTAIATTACNVKQGVDAASLRRIPDIETLLIRHGNLLATLGSELQSGRLKSTTINAVMNMLHGDPKSAKAVANLAEIGGTPEASLPYTRSAAWRRASGGVINTNMNGASYTPDILKAVLPQKNGAQDIVSQIDAAANVATLGAGNLACTILASPVGVIIQGAVGTIQFFADLGSFSATQAAITSGLVAFQLTLQYVIMPQVLSYFTVAGVSGTEAPVQWLNNSDAGLTLAYDNYSRHMGSLPLTKTKASALLADATTSQNLAYQHTSWSYRMFSLDNPKSMFSSMFSHIPYSFSSATLRISNYITQFPSMITNAFASILPGASAAGTVNPSPYDTTRYALEAPDKYDPIVNEQYLKSSVTYNGKTATRLSMLGDPYSYNESSSGDSNNDDLLHCFKDSNQVLEVTTNTEQRHFCGYVGTFDSVDEPPEAVTTSDGMPTIPNDTTIEHLYCKNLIDDENNADCMAQIGSQIKDDVGHFTQYIADSMVMKNYKSLSNAN